MGCAVGDTPAVQTWVADSEPPRSVPEGLLGCGKDRIQGLIFVPFGAPHRLIATARVFPVFIRTTAEEAL